MSYQTRRFFPRAQLKEEAKLMMRPHWKPILLITLFYIIFLGVNSYTFTQYTSSSSVDGVMYSYSVSGAAGLYSTFASGEISAGHFVLTALIGIVFAVLIEGVLSYCYTAFFVKMAERPGQPMTVSIFVEGFNDAVKAGLAYIWQYLWTAIWGLAMLPGVIFMGFGMFGLGIHSEGVYLALVFIGLGLFLVGCVMTIMATLRYVFMYQAIADGRGKIGARQSMRISVALAKSRLGDIFVLALSFIPWLIFGAFTFGLGYFYVLPYMESTYALCYRWLRDDAFREGRLDPAVLGYVEQSAKAPTPQADPVGVMPVATVTDETAEAEVVEAPVEDVVEVTDVAPVEEAVDVTPAAEAATQEPSASDKEERQ